MAEHSKRQEILEAAAQLFRDKGYSATSMRDLAKAVSLKASSLYNHIGGKEEILREICYSNAQRFLDAMKTIEAQPDGIIEKLQSLIRLHIQMAMEDITSVTAFNDEWRHLSGEHLDHFRGLRKDYERRFKQILQEGMDKGLLKPVDTTIALYTILSSMRWLYDWYRPEGRKTKEEIEQELTIILLKGLAV
ncbi:MAG: TetR/AcrR family transcriptional regulator [Bacteroidota bacterium]